ncbi:MAG: undecaprenyl/decaprenyl-phosphate alpha-N-acetylglucosaminyl 1-phosphate transferase [Chloroflexi bacterium]|nr:undecaprenyl/decaprenyl-phosphate alpha-N-acetylglucosaminyl 1-phosphate transferase [Chloroflexota bacterium]
MSILVLLIALSFALVVTPLVRQLALRINFVAVPRQDRAHRVVTPMMGGVALYLGLTGAILLLTLGAVLISSTTELDRSWPLEELYIILISGTLIAAIGLWDDWKGLSPPLKGLLQLPPILVLPLATSVEIGMNVPDAVNFFLTICWFMYVVNAYNYLDNMDGVAAMTATVAGMFFTVIAVINDQFLVASLAAAIAGTSFGFLRYNLFTSGRAAIFMGDVGSLFIGYLLAVIGVKLSFAAESPWITWPVPVLVLGIPIFDTGLVFISRMRRGQSFLQGGTDHLSHRFARLDFGRFGVPLAIGMIGSALGCTALLVMHSSLVDSLFAQATVGGLALFLLYKLEFSQSYEFITGKEPPQHMPDSASAGDIGAQVASSTPDPSTPL